LLFRHADSFSSPVSARVIGENAPAQYDFHAGDAFLQALNPAFGGRVIGIEIKLRQRMGVMT